jgi:hypothetical protein
MEQRFPTTLTYLLHPIMDLLLTRWRVLVNGAKNPTVSVKTLTLRGSRRGNKGLRRVAGSLRGCLRQL